MSSLNYEYYNTNCIIIIITITTTTTTITTTTTTNTITTITTNTENEELQKLTESMEWTRIKIFVWAQKYQELVNNLLQSYQKLGCNMSLKYTSITRIWIFSQRIVVQWVVNSENVSIKTFLQWRRDIEGSGTVLCLPTAAGLWQGMSLPWNTSDRQNQKYYMILFVLNNELTWKRLCRYSIYVVNIVSKQNKSTKHILYHWILFSFYSIHRSL